MKKRNLTNFFKFQSKRIIVLANIFLFSVIMLLFYYCYLQNRLLEINILDNNIVALEDKISEIYLNYGNRQNVIEEIDKIDIELQRLKGIVNDYFQPHEIINDLDKIITQNNMHIIEFNISEPQEFVINLDEKQNVYITTTTLKLSGNYENIRSTINDIQNCYRFYKITSLHLNALSSDIIELSVLLSSYSKELNKSPNEKNLEPHTFPSNKNPFETFVMPHLKNAID